MSFDLSAPLLSYLFNGDQNEDNRILPFKKVHGKRNERINQLPPDVLGSKVKMANCYHRRQWPRNGFSGAGKSRNAVICANVSWGNDGFFTRTYPKNKVMISLPDLHITLRFWHWNDVLIRKTSSVQQTKTSLTISSFICFSKNLSFLFK